MTVCYSIRNNLKYSETFKYIPRYNKSSLINVQCRKTIAYAQLRTFWIPSALCVLCITHIICRMVPEQCVLDRMGTDGKGMRPRGWLELIEFERVSKYFAVIIIIMNVQQLLFYGYFVYSNKDISAVSCGYLLHISILHRP